MAKTNMNHMENGCRLDVTIPSVPPVISGDPHDSRGTLFGLPNRSMSCSHRSACAELSLVVSRPRGLWPLPGSEHLLAGRKAYAAGRFLPHQACFEQFPICWDSPP